MKVDRYVTRQTEERGRALAARHARRAAGERKREEQRVAQQQQGYRTSSGREIEEQPHASLLSLSPLLVYIFCGDVCCDGWC